MTAHHPKYRKTWKMFWERPISRHNKYLWIRQRTTLVRSQPRFSTCGAVLISEWTGRRIVIRSEEHTSELQSLMRTSYAVFCLKKKNTNNTTVLTLTAKE